MVNDLSQSLANRLSPVIIELNNDSERRLTKSEQYLSNCLLAVGEVETLCKQLNQAKFFLSSFKNTETSHKAGITRFDYIIYNVESYLLRVTGILDRVLILYNEALLLGLTTKQCTVNNFFQSENSKLCKNIKKHSQVLYDKLIELKDLTSQYTNKRNEVAHQRRFYEKETMYTMELYHVVIQANANDRLNDEVLIEDLKFYRIKEQNKFVANYKKQINAFNKHIDSTINSIFLEIESLYVSIYSAIY